MAPDGSLSSESAPDKVFLEACNIYFRHCHNKPFGFFNATFFHEKVQEGRVPLHLKLALIASATRYSSRSQWMERKQSTIDSYARCSWELITTSSNPLDQSDDVDVIQSLVILAVIDATAGRRRPAWVKIGMAVRIAQDLDMMLEPAPNLPELERDERRNLFWSLYLLDRFVCCSFQRPPAINDSDCLLNLPTHYRSRKRLPSITLSDFFNEKIRSLSPRSGMFGISIGLAACLGRTTKYMMSKSETSLPWSSGSEYCMIHRDLEYLKELAVKNGPVLGAPGQAQPHSDNPNPDREQIAHMVLSHTLYHLSHCILSHPFLIGLKIGSRSHPDMPLMWVEDTRKRCLSHAGSLITVLVEAKAAGYMPVTSVYSYSMVLASTVHGLFMHCDDSSIRQTSAEYLQPAFDYLLEMSDLWDNAHIMTSALENFIQQCPRYSDILLRNQPRMDEFTTTELTILKYVVDYWAMMDARNPVFQQTLTTLTAKSQTKSPDYQNPSCSYSSSVPVEPSPDDKAANDWDPDISVTYPLPAMSPIPSEDGSSKWDWDRELDLNPDT
ncbi:hypothetical protein N7520_006877 [Penicillium odoratum]|uniref:uncharacterized protein n=1 Tax=Penicillium odoratum TaxID=1167516 RepID=UPI002548CFF7|nr:uncharacterized protein N7520_006877 [Penicillium odoratum]KAJ5759721.1 hypothetical protein N7520_006877 [Penicillium odoratum]